MGTKQVTLKTKRYFSGVFKKAVVNKYEKSKFSIQFGHNDGSNQKLERYCTRGRFLA